MTRETILRIAAAAQCDPRTVATYAAGGNVRPLLRGRIEAAMKALRVKTRSQRFDEAHAWVLEHHAETFRKLAKK